MNYSMVQYRYYPRTLTGQPDTLILKSCSTPFMKANAKNDVTSISLLFTFIGNMADVLLTRGRP